ncbi:MAG: hypothetical protein IPG12_10990 [Saprospiraceae bacterium]|nr:hypothetical protein [Saprospiraceae bacterium]
MFAKLLTLLFVILIITVNKAQPKVQKGETLYSSKWEDDPRYHLETPDSIAFRGLRLDMGKIYDYDIIGVATSRSNKKHLAFGPHVYQRNLFTGFILFGYEKLDSFESELTISTNLPLEQGIIDPEKLSEKGSDFFFLVNVNKIKDDVQYASYKLDYSKLPNFLKIVSYDKSTKILKARFRLYFILDTNNTNDYLLDKFTLDDGIIYTKILN